MYYHISRFTLCHERLATQPTAHRMMIGDHMDMGDCIAMGVCMDM
jgi:hypothetical protein